MEYTNEDAKANKVVEDQLAELNNEKINNLTETVYDYSEKVTDGEPDKKEKKKAADLTIKKYLEHHGIEQNYDKSDFVENLLIGGLSPEFMSSVLGNDLSMKSENDYWENETIRNDFETFAKKEGDTEESLRKKFSLYYKNIQGAFSDFKKGVHEQALSKVNLPVFATSAVTQNDKVGVSGIVRELKAERKDSGVEYNGTIYSQEESNRQKDVGQIRLVHFDSKGKPFYEYVDATEVNTNAVLSMEGVNGLAYNEYSADVGRGFIDVIKDNKVWNDKFKTFVPVKGRNVVSSWDYAYKKGTLASTLMSGNKLEMEGFFNHLLLIPRSLFNTFNNIKYMAPELIRAGIGAFWGDNADNDDALFDIGAYKYLSDVNISHLSKKTSMSDEARREGFFGSREQQISVISDVAMQLLLAGLLGRGGQILGEGATGALAGSTSKIAAIATDGAMWAAENFTRLSLTMMASASFYQEALDNGLSKRQAGYGTAAVTVAMWFANSLSAKVIEGVGPKIAKDASNKLITKITNKAARAIQPGIDQADDAARLFGAIGGFGEKLGSLLSKGKAALYTNDYSHAFIIEASEEIFEDSSTEIIRQAINAINMATGEDLKSMKIGEGRFKSFYDPNYWKELMTQLAVSGIAGGIGGPMGKVMLGGSHQDKIDLTNAKGFVSFYAIGKGDILEKAVENRYAKGLLGSTNLSPVIDDETGAFISEGKSMNDYMYELLQLEMLEAKTTIETIGKGGLDVGTMLKNNPEIADHLDRTNLFRDVENISIELRALLKKTGLGTEFVNNIEDEDIQMSLVDAKEGAAIRRDALVQQYEQLEKEIEAVKLEKQGKDLQQEYVTELEKKVEELEKAKEQTKTEKDNLDVTVSEQDLNRIKELSRKIRGLQNGFAAETYLIESLLYDDQTVGAIHMRNADFMGYSEDLLFNLFEDARNSNNDDKKLIIKKIEKSAETSARILGITENDIDTLNDIFKEEVYLSREAYDHLKKLVSDLSVSPSVKEPLLTYIRSDEFIDDIFNVEYVKHSNAFENVTDEVNSHGVHRRTLKLFKPTTQEEIENSNELREAFKSAIFDALLLVEPDTNIQSIHIPSFYTTKAFSDTYIDYIDGNSHLMSILEIVSDPNMKPFDIVPNNKIAENFGAFEESNNLGNKIKSLLNKDTRYATANMHFRNIQNENIDIKVPNLNDSYNLNWMHKRLNIDNTNGEIQSKPGFIADDILRIEETYLNSDDTHSVFFMPQSIQDELKELRKELILRQKQKAIIQLLTSNINIALLAKYRKNVRETLAPGSMFNSKSRVFSQSEVHNYKDHSVISDFFNDYIVDPERIAELTAKYSNDKSTLTEAEKEELDNFTTFAYNLSPTDEVAQVVATGDLIQLMRNISNYRELKRGVEHLSISYSLEQGLEVIDGIFRLLENFPMNSDKTKMSPVLANRHTFILKRLFTLSRPKSSIAILNDLYTINGLEFDEDLKAALKYFENYYSNKIILNSNDDFIEAEKYIMTYYTKLADIRRALGDDLFQTTIDNIQGMWEDTRSELILYSSVDMASISRVYLEAVKDLSEKNIVPAYLQEKNAILITAFILANDNLKLKTNENTGLFYYLMGEAGTGKTKLMGLLALQMAQKLNRDKKATKILYSARDEHQVKALGEGLKTLNTTEGYTNTKLFSLLSEYTQGNADAIKELDSVYTIFIDEATLLNARVKDTGEQTLNELYKLLTEVNKIRTAAGGKQLRIILSGDEGQTGFTDNNVAAEESSTEKWINENGQFIGTELDFTFRVGNEYISQGIKKVRNLKNIMSFSGKNTLVKWGTQEKHDNIRMGLHIVSGKHGDFDSMLDDDLYNDIVMRLDKDKNFKVLFIHSTATQIPGNSRMAQLAAKYANVEVKPENRIQGKEVDYVIAEWNDHSIDNIATAIDQNDALKQMYTTVSRATTYVKVLNANNANISSVQIDDRAIVPTETEKTEDSTFVTKRINDVFVQFSNIDPEEVERRRLEDEARKLKRKLALESIINIGTDIVQKIYTLKGLTAEYTLNPTDINLKKQIDALEIDIETSYKLILSTSKTLNTTVDEDIDIKLTIEKNINEIATLLNDADSKDLFNKSYNEFLTFVGKLFAGKITFNDNVDTTQVSEIEKTIKEFSITSTLENTLVEYEDRLVSKLAGKDLKYTNTLRKVFREAIESILVLDIDYANLADVLDYIEGNLSDEENIILIKHKLDIVNTINDIKDALKSERDEVMLYVDDALGSFDTLFDKDTDIKIIESHIINHVVNELTNKYLVNIDVFKNSYDAAYNKTLELIESRAALSYKSTGKPLEIKLASITDSIENEDSNPYRDVSDAELLQIYDDLLKNKYNNLAGINDYMINILNNLVFGIHPISKVDMKEITMLTDLLNELNARKGLGHNISINYKLITGNVKLIHDVSKVRAYKNVNIPGISDAAVFTMKANQMDASNPDAFSTQIHPLINDDEIKLAKKIINSATGGNVDILTDEISIAELYMDTKRIQEIRFIGGKDDFGNPNGYFVASTYANRKTTHVVLGKFFFGFFNTTLVENIIKEKEKLNKELKLEGTVNQLVDADKNNLDNLFRKLYPTTHRLQLKIQNAAGPYVKQLPLGVVKNIIKNSTIGAGKQIRNDNSLMLVDDLRSKMALKNIQISNHIVINNGADTFKGVTSGNSFILYTTASSSLVDLQNKEVVQNIIANDGEFYAESIDGSFVRIKIGMIPLVRGEISFNEIYDTIFSSDKVTRDYDSKPLGDYNRSLDGFGTNDKMAKVLISLVEQFGVDPRLLDMIKPFIKVGDNHYDNTTWGTNIAKNVLDVVETMKNKFSDVSITKGKEVNGALNSNDIDAFIELLDTTNMSGVHLSTDEVISAIMMPLMRNFSTAMYTENYDAGYYSVLHTHKDKSVFSTFTYFAAITKEIQVRLNKIGKTSDADVDTYMKKLILPAMEQLFATSDIFNAYSKNLNAAPIKLDNGKFVTTGLTFLLSPLNQKIKSNIENNRNKRLVLAETLPINKTMVTGIHSIELPSLTINAKELLASIFDNVPEEDLNNSAYNPISKEVYTKEYVDQTVVKIKQDITNLLSKADTYLLEINDKKNSYSISVDDVDAIKKSFEEKKKEIKEKLDFISNDSTYDTERTLLNSYIVILTRASESLSEYKKDLIIKEDDKVSQFDTLVQSHLTAINAELNDVAKQKLVDKAIIDIQAKYDNIESKISSDRKTRAATTLKNFLNTVNASTIIAQQLKTDQDSLNSITKMILDFKDKGIKISNILLKRINANIANIKDAAIRAEAEKVVSSYVNGTGTTTVTTIRNIITNSSVPISAELESVMNELLSNPLSADIITNLMSNINVMSDLVKYADDMKAVLELVDSLSDSKGYTVKTVNAAFRTMIAKKIAYC